MDRNGAHTIRDSGLVDRVRAALDLAAKPSTSAVIRQQVDREAVALLHYAPSTADREALLAQVDLGLLAALLERATQAVRAGAPADADGGAKAANDGVRLTWDLLDLVRSPAVLRRIAPAERNTWAERILAAIEASRFTVGPLFRQRAASYGSKVLFEIPRPDGLRTLTWRQTASRVDFLARGLLSLDSAERPAPIAILSENRLEMALVDLACLTSGLMNVMIPANSTEVDVGYMLRHSGAGAVVVSTPQQLDKVLAQRESLPALKRIVTIEPHGSTPRASEGILTLDELSARALHIPESLVTARSERVGVDDPATVMYTSGTTGMPKGIQFSHRNLVFKRFARALALPEIGEDDRFLCFLPLFHTFGRFLEMMGCVFWGATYRFLENTSADALIRGMADFRPTVFISVPKKWLQLYEAIGRSADPLQASDEALAAATAQVTGGKLRWGLSAAGHLPTDVFRFFQRQGVELMSGFGMTEATGGITMTPPGEYRDDSLGFALPGVETELAEDGELLVRGPYVMMGYLDPPDGAPSFDADGWLHTGDLMQLDHEGHLRLIDRKKEIYKNIKGETIAPQRVENPFRDFESVGRVFLVGDHREYNTLLIWPNPAYSDLDIASMSAEKQWEHYRSLVVSVNQFLAPYERIVDFALIDRDLDAARGELTEKGSPKRRVVERNFADVIDQLYRRTDLVVGGVQLTLPNWLFQVLGLTAQDFAIDSNRLVMQTTGNGLTVQALDATGGGGARRVRIGSALYDVGPGAVNLGALLTAPALWLGNDELVQFVPLEPGERVRPGRRTRRIAWAGYADHYRPLPRDLPAVEIAMAKSPRDLMDLDLAARLASSADESAAIRGVELAGRVLEDNDPDLVTPARQVLARAAEDAPVGVARRALCELAGAEQELQFDAILRRFLDAHPDLLDSPTRRRLTELTLSNAKVEALIGVTNEACAADGTHALDRAGALLDLLASYGAFHPASYRRLRAVLTRIGSDDRRETLRERATAAAARMTEGFRAALGKFAQMAIDPDSGREYRWSDVVVFEDGIPEIERDRIMDAIEHTSFLREAFFLFSRGTLINLDDIPPGGVWIRLLGALHGKSVYRVTLQSRAGAYDLAVNLNTSLPRERIDEEILWLILCGDPGNRGSLVEDFGGYWPEQDLWSEEFISGETLDRALRRLTRRNEDTERLRQLWPFLAWSTLSAYVDFWDRTGRRLEIADPSMTNVVVPTEDFQIGSRLVSVSARRPHRRLLSMLQTFREELLLQAERRYPALEGRVGPELVFAALLEIVGEAEGLDLLEQAAAAPGDAPHDLLEALRGYVTRTRDEGFRPLRLHFAIERYHRWEQLSTEPTLQARAQTVHEISETYALHRLARALPQVRFRLFRDTVFRDARPALAEGLDAMIGRIRAGELHEDEFVDAVADLRSKLDLEPDEEYFLARMSLPHLRPEDSAGFVSSSLGGRQQSEIVVSLEDHDGGAYRVRHAMSPKEVERLYRLFLAARLEVQFRAEHRYLVAINERDQIIAGIYYDIDEDGKSAHLEKIVAAEAYRRKGVADGVMREFFNRLRAAGVETVTTGFFRPEYFYTYGFRIEKRYAGLVKSLDTEAVAP